MLTRGCVFDLKDSWFVLGHWAVEYFFLPLTYEDTSVFLLFASSALWSVQVVSLWLRDAEDVAWTVSAQVLWVLLHWLLHLAVSSSSIWKVDSKRWIGQLCRLLTGNFVRVVSLEWLSVWQLPYIKCYEVRINHNITTLVSFCCFGELLLDLSTNCSQQSKQALHLFVPLYLRGVNYVHLHFTREKAFAFSIKVKFCFTQISATLSVQFGFLTSWFVLKRDFMVKLAYTTLVFSLQFEEFC